MCRPVRHQHRRYRLTIAMLALVVIGLGLLSRSALLSPTSFLGRYSGDTLWALLVYLLIRWLFPAQPVVRSACYAALFALAIEISQLYHALWIDRLRAMRLVQLVLGSGFLWRDLLCYAVGITIGAALEVAFRRWRLRSI